MDRSGDGNVVPSAPLKTNEKPHSTSAGGGVELSGMREGREGERLPIAVEGNSSTEIIPVGASGGRVQSVDADDAEIVVRVQGLTKHYSISGREEKVVALNGIYLNENDEKGFEPIRRGEFVMIRGPSGGGKTTLLNILGTLDYPTDGKVEILGETVDRDSTDQFLADLRLRRIGFVFQTFNLISTMSAFENVELPMIIASKLTKKECKRRAIELLERVGLGDRLEHLPSELSGGEQQRVTVARALSNEPELLLLDEPTGDLDTKNTLEIMELILEINQTRNVTCIMVSHNPDLEVYANRILYVRDGRFEKEAKNVQQSKIELEKYLEFLDRRLKQE